MFVTIGLVCALFLNAASSGSQHKHSHGEYHHHSDYGWDWQWPDRKDPEDKIINKELGEIKSPVTLPSTTLAPTPEEYKPCDPYNVKKPDYSAPNRRLSEVKCYDYIWNVKMQDEVAKRAVDCFVEESRKRNEFAVLSGRETNEGEFPHMAAIGWQGTSGSYIFKCGGSLISPNFVLTAGHCTQVPEDTSIADTDPKIIRLGVRNVIIKYVRNIPTDVKISQIIPHPLYAPPKKYNDIALMKLERNVEFTIRIYPACLWTNMNVESAGPKGTVTGWGVVKLGAKVTSPTLQAAEVDMVESGVCNELLEPHCNRHWCGLEGHQLCAGTLAGGPDTCQGDSGGPIQVKIKLPAHITMRMYFVLGVTSFGFQCGQPNIPGIYTKVSSFADWIESIVWKQN